jgi:amino acid permease
MEHFLTFLFSPLALVAMLVLALTVFAVMFYVIILAGIFVWVCVESTIIRLRGLKND